jgi:hypothetical protein
MFKYKHKIVSMTNVTLSKDRKCFKHFRAFRVIKYELLYEYLMLYAPEDAPVRVEICLALKSIILLIDVI